MDTFSISERTKDWVKKYRYVALVLLLGVFLMTFPQKQKEQSPSTQQQVTAVSDLEEQLEEILCHLDGAGKVRVLLTRASGEETVYQTDADRGSDDLRTETVILNGSDREETGLIRQINPPRYLGAVVLCQGADNAAVKLSLVQAVATATGLTSDKISVLKMK